MAKKKFVTKYRVHGITHDKEKGQHSVHEAGAVVEMDDKADATIALVASGAIALAEKEKEKEDADK